MSDVDDAEGRRARRLFDALTQAAEVAGISITLAYVTETGAEIEYTNDVGPKLLGVSREEVNARGVWSFIDPEELPKLLDMHGRRLRGEPIPISFETVLVRADGERIPVEIATHRLELDGRQAAVTFLSDVSQRKRAEDALRRSEALFRTLAESAPDGIAILRFPEILYVNERGAQMLGKSCPSDVIGTSLLDHLSPNDADVAAQRARRRKAGEPVRDAVEYTVRATGSTIEVSASAIEYEGRHATLGFARDVTERKHMLTRLLESEKLAALGTLAAGVAHEVNNPLAYMLLNLEILERQVPKLIEDPSLLPSLMKLIADARHGGGRVKTIVRDLQTFTRRDDGTGGPVQLDAAIDAALSIVAHELRSASDVIKRFEPTPPVLGNATRFEQLFLNLTVNAIHAIADVPLERRVIEFAVRPGPGDTVLATVRDEGVGMAPETLARAFEPFFTTKPVGVGSGLGLSICQGIARRAAGELTIESELGRGTTVTLTLPAYRGAGPQAAAASARSDAPASTSRAAVLVVDDEPAIAASLAEALRDEHDVAISTSVAHARARLAAGERYDVVLCDVVMPGESGPSLLEFLRRERPELVDHFAFMTGGASLPSAERVRAETSSPQLEKPFEIDAVRALIARLR